MIINVPGYTGESPYFLASFSEDHFDMIISSFLLWVVQRRVTWHAFIKYGRDISRFKFARQSRRNISHQISRLELASTNLTF